MLATDKAPLCKGGWRRRRLGDCLAYGMYFQSLRLFATQKSTSLCKGGFFFCCKLRIISRHPPLASPLGERCRRSRRRGEFKTGGRLPPLRNHRKIVATSLPPSDEGGVTAGDGGREHSARVVEDADPYGVTAKSAQNPCLPLTREVSPQVTEGENILHGSSRTPTPTSSPQDYGNP